MADSEEWVARAGETDGSGGVTEPEPTSTSPPTHYTQPEPRPHGGGDRAIPGLRAFEATCYLARRQRGRIRRIPKLLAGWLVLVEERAAQRVVHLRGGESRRAHLRDEAADNSINSERGHRVSEQRRYRRVPTWVKRRDRSETHTCLSINHKPRRGRKEI